MIDLKKELHQDDNKFEEITKNLLQMIKFFRDNYPDHENTTTIIYNLKSACKDAHAIRIDNIDPELKQNK